MGVVSVGSRESTSSGVEGGPSRLRSASSLAGPRRSWGSFPIPAILPNNGGNLLRIVADGCGAKGSRVLFSPIRLLPGCYVPPVANLGGQHLVERPQIHG